MERYLVDFETITTHRKFEVKTNDINKIEAYFISIYIIPQNNEITIVKIDKEGSCEVDDIVILY